MNALNAIKFLTLLFWPGIFFVRLLAHSPHYQTYRKAVMLHATGQFINLGRYYYNATSLWDKVPLLLFLILSLVVILEYVGSEEFTQGLVQ